jgi:tetratricopeptide (TPR) repeat protein
VPGEPTGQRSGAGLTSPWRRALAIARRKRVAGDLDGAVRDLQAALELDPDEAELSIELAETFADSGNYSIARTILGDTLKALGDEGNIELRLRSLYCLATVIEHLENPAEAMHCLEELLIIRHDYRDSRERLETLKEQMRGPVNAPVAPSNIAANVILEGILDLLNSRANEGAEVSD